MRGSVRSAALTVFCRPSVAAVAQSTGTATLAAVTASRGRHQLLGADLSTLLFFDRAVVLTRGAAVLMTGFTRIVILLSLLRQAMARRRAPPNQVVNRPEPCS